MATLEHAILLAVQAHRGQVDKAGQPYILHPLRVMGRVEPGPEQVVAVLHDVVEDTSYTLEMLRDLGYAEAILTALDCLIRRPGETYPQFIQRVADNPIARRVKLADLEDNMDLRRLPVLEPHDVVRLQRYLRAGRLLKAT